MLFTLKVELFYKYVSLKVRNSYMIGIFVDPEGLKMLTFSYFDH